LQNRPLVQAQDLRRNLRAENFSLDSCNPQQLKQCRVKSVEALADNCLNPHR
jgi:hypothetical protein